MKLRAKGGAVAPFLAVNFDRFGTIRELLKMTSPIKNSKPSADTLEKYKGKSREQLLIDLEHLEGVAQCASVDIWAGTISPLDELLSLLTLTIESLEREDFKKGLIVDSLNGIKRGVVRVLCDAIEKCEELEGGA